jgi:mannosyltransferase OCH1-like enzyme
MLIPKIAHIAWPDKQVINSQSPIILNGLRNLIDLNPDWNVVINDDNDIDSYLSDNLDPSDYFLVKDISIVEKSDLWRLIKLYYEGGLYMDIDRFFNIKLSDIIDQNTRCVLPICLDWDFSQDLMLTAPNSPILKTAIELALDRRRNGHTSVFFLGPQTYMHAITQTLFNEVIDTNPGKEVFDQIRAALNQSPFIKIYNESPPYDTLVYKHNIETFKQGNSILTDWQELKQEFYASYKVKHWSGEW